VQPALAILIRNSLLMLGAMVVTFVLLKDNMGLLTASVQHAANEYNQSSEQSDEQSSTEQYGSANEGEMVIDGDVQGHYMVDAEVDGREVGFVVDTGATSVVLSEQDAETAGFYVEQLEFTLRVHTASGIARAAPITIQEIVLGDIIVKNVRGAVIQGYTGRSLLGMTFLSRLDGFQVKDNQLVLRY
jgi:aspartyl protease family protein